MNEISDQEIKKEIFIFIESNPGLYQSKIAKLLNIPISSLEKHLQNMQKEKIITCIMDNGLERFYVEKRKLGITKKRTSEIRDRVYYLISENPGLHLSKLAELMDIRISLVEYHLKYLEKKNKIVAVKEGSYYKRYYTKDSEVGLEDKKTIQLLRKELPLKIVIFLLDNPSSMYKEIQNHLGISAPLLTYHLNKLVDHGIINPPSYFSKEYSLVNKKEITNILKKYRMNALINGFKDIWAGLDYYNR